MTSGTTQDPTVADVLDEVVRILEVLSTRLIEAEKEIVALKGRIRSNSAPALHRDR